MNKYFILIGLFLFSYISTKAQSHLIYNSKEEKEMFEQIFNKDSLKYDYVDCMLIAEKRENVLTVKDEKLKELTNYIFKEIPKNNSYYRNGKNLFKILHSKLFKKFTSDASMEALLVNGEYNCITASAIYYYYANQLGINMLFHAMPEHVCPIVLIDNKKIWVELTNPSDGYDFDYKKKDIVNLLLESKYITQEEINNKGVDNIFNDFISGNFVEDPYTFLSYRYYNYSLELYNTKKYIDAFWAIAKAYHLHKNDKYIQALYDELFINVCSEEKKYQPLTNLISLYLNDRKNDSTAIQKGLKGVIMATIYLSEDRNNLAKLDSIANIVNTLFSQKKFVKEEVEKINSMNLRNKAFIYMQDGKYEESYNILSIIFATDTNNTRIQSLYTDAGILYSEKLFKNGKDEIAHKVIDTLMQKFNNNVRIIDAYINMLISTNMASRKYITQPLIAYKNLLNGFKKDSNNTMLREALSEVCHKLALNDIRKGNYVSAKNRLIEALTYTPNNEIIEKDLKDLYKDVPKLKETK